ncbi:hypothetical protein BX666DRAFT_1911711 [Dichotomocladium elegans]|nr:hypothetical protein BX666DRAFT_1911711 [Dichotomocladium elegans]
MKLFDELQEPNLPKKKVFTSRNVMIFDREILLYSRGTTGISVFLSFLLRNSRKAHRLAPCYC